MRVQRGPWSCIGVTREGFQTTCVAVRKVFFKLLQEKCFCILHCGEHWRCFSISFSVYLLKQSEYLSAFSKLNYGKTTLFLLLFSSYQSSTCCLTFCCESVVIFDISFAGHCLGRSVVLPFIPESCPFLPALWVTFLWSLACLALLRVAFCCLTSPLLHPKIHSDLLWFCPVTSLLLLPVVIHWLPALCFITLNCVPSLHDAQCFLFISPGVKR